MADKMSLAYIGVNELPVSDAITGTDQFISIDATTGNVSYIAASDLATYAASGGIGPFTVTVADADAFDVGANGATNPVLQVDTNTASVATGVKITGAAAAGGVAVEAISSGTNEALSIDAKGSGALTLAGTSTGGIKSGSSTADQVAVKGIYMNGTSVAVAVPTIADAEIDEVAVDVSSAFTFQPAVGDSVIAIPQEALPTDCILCGAYVSATDTITVSFAAKEGGSGVTGANKNFKFLVLDLT